MNDPSGLDHLVLATPDVAATAAWLAATTGVTPSPGGPHLGRGTHNVLCSLGPGRYLEVIGPDPDQDEPAEPRPFGVDDVDGPRLVTWCLRPESLDEHIRVAAAAGVEYTVPEAMSRRSLDGVLEWRLAFVRSGGHGGLVPFVIDWGHTVHPSTTVASGLSLESFTARHPHPDPVRDALRAMGLNLDVSTGASIGLTAVLVGPGGRAVLGA